MERSKRNKILQVVMYVLIFLIPLIVIFTSIYVYDNYLYKDNVEQEDEKIEVEEVEESSEPEVSVEPYVNELPSARELYNNQNIMGRLEIPNMNIDTYVTRTTDNSYYLNYNLYNVYDQIGAPFFDYRNTSLSTDKQINIYGHNTQNEAIVDKLPFTNLERYTDETVFNANRDIYLYIDETKIHYKIIAIKIITTDIEHMKVIFSDNNDFLEHANKLLANSLYIDSEETVKKKDRLLVLQICHYDPMDSYLLVIAKEVEN